MEQFVVSARKYRPDTFDTVVGQEQVTGTLKNAIRSKHVAQAYLFTGPRGVGKTTCARILARTVNCENLGDDLVPCGDCKPCITFEEGHSLNIYELDAASNNGVDHIRNLIQQVQIAPQVGDRKVYIIDEVHMLSKDAFNAFLKTLEEPPSYAIFILATTEKHKVLPTILSRCQVFDFRRITVADIAAHLAKIAENEGIVTEAQALHVIAQKADGGLRDALSIFDQLVSFSGHKLTYQDVVQNLNVLDHDHYFELTDAILGGDTASALVGFNNILQQGFDGQLFVAGLGRHFRDLLVCRDVRTLPLLEVSDDLRPRYEAQAKAMSNDLLVRGLEHISEVDTRYKLSKEPRLLVELLLIRLCRDGRQSGSVKAAQAPAAAEKKDTEPEPERASRAATVPAPAPVAAKPARQSAPSSAAAEPIPAGHASEETPQVEALSPPVATTASVRRRASVSIKQYMDRSQEKDDDVLTSARNNTDTEVVVRSDRKVSEALLHKVWNDFALARKREGRNSLHATLTAREPKAAAPGLVSFAIMNEVQERYMRDERPELMGYLRRELGDPDLELEVLREEVEVKPRYTQMDRFKLMAEKNPAVITLKQVLDLDLG